MQVAKEVKISLHEHVLKLHENADFDDEQWLCNGVDIFGESGGCKHGMTEYKEKQGVPGYSCDFVDSCDFDLCKKCIQYSLWID